MPIKNHLHKVLIVASGFPPQGGGGVTRVHSFVKYLKQFGWEPIVLTLREDYAYKHAIDFSLLDEYDSSIQIKRTGSLEPNKLFGRDIKKNITGFGREQTSSSNILRKLIKFLYEIFLIPDEKLLWILPALLEIKRILDEEEIDLVFITTPPHSTSLIGPIIKILKKTPFVWDVRDDWIGNPYFSSNLVHRRKIEKLMESLVVSSAARIVVVTKESYALVRKKYPSFSNKCTLIYNGFDPKLFSKMENSKPILNDKLRIVYSGSLTQRRDLGSFFKAVAELNSKNKLLEIIVVGSVHQRNINQIKSLGIEEIVKLTGYVSHQKSIEYITKADVCLLISTTNEGSKTVIPSKVYEYIGARKYILALASEDSAVKNLIQSQRIGLVIPPYDKEIIKSSIANLIKCKKNGKLNYEVSPEVYQKFNRILLTERLANVFDQVIEQGKKIAN